MRKRRKQSLSLIFTLFGFLLFGVLSLTPAYAGPETLGPSRVQELHRADTVGIPAQYFGETADDDAEPVAVTMNERAELPAMIGQVSSSEKRAIPFRSASGFDAFNAGYENQWRASFSEKTGKVKVLYGGFSKQYENGPESVARGFLGDSHMVFGLKQDLSDLKTQRVDKTPERDHVRFQQTYNNIPIIGALVLVHSNPRGQVTMVQNDYIHGFQVANARVISVESAKNTARNDLQASLPKGAILSDAKVEEVIAPHKENYYYVWKIAIPTRNPWGYWVYHVDAAIGEILSKGNEIRSLKTGKGRAFKSNANWFLGKISNVPLKNMFTSAEGYSEGYLWGLHADIWDDFDGTYIYKTFYSPTYTFLTDPISHKDWFDAIDAYYQMNTVWDWWNKNVISKYGPSSPDYFYDNPPAATVVNCVDPACLCNAFYYPPNYLFFGDQNSCAAGSEDLVIDNDVVRHEFTHAMMDWNGFDAQFGGPEDYYGRAMGEGNSDWFAFLNHTKDPGIAGVAWYWSGFYLRYLDWTQMYPVDVGCSGGMPEEHCTGEIWGGYLYDLYRVLKGNALKYVYNSFYYFSPSGGWMDGYPDFFDGIMAQISADYDLTENYKSSFKAWGSMASRGINGFVRSPYCHNPYFGTGANGCDNWIAFFWSLPDHAKAITTKGNLLVSGDPHEYVIYVDAGWDLTATVTGKSGGLTNPYIYLYTGLGALVTSVGPSSPTKATLTSYNVPSGIYVVRVTGNATSPARGYYTFKVSVK